MPKNSPLAAIDPSDPAVLDYLARVQRICIAIVAVVAASTLCAWIIVGLGFALPPFWTLMKANTALVALASAVGFSLSEHGRSRRSLFASRALAVLVGAIAAASLVEHAFGISLGVNTFVAADRLSRHPGLMSPQSGSSFLLLAIALFFVRASKGVARHFADFCVAAVSFLVLVVVSGYLFGATSPFSIAPSNWTSPQALLSLSLLSFVAFSRRAEYGVFSILVGTGNGSRIARVLTPILLALPFLREIGRVRLLNNHLLPPHYASAILASLAAVLSFGLLMILAARINKMEVRIKDLSLRDELTGLANLRGFRVLAEQALRLAKRSRKPFSVLFIDVDELKQINDKLGHRVGSMFLVDTAKLLKTTFRESDVVGRIGGDEFAVCGLFSDTAIEVAVARLHAGAALRTPDPTGHMPLSLSTGHVTVSEHGNVSLENLLAQADTAMYEQKNLKKT